MGINVFLPSERERQFRHSSLAFFSISTPCPETAIAKPIKLSLSARVYTRTRGAVRFCEDSNIPSKYPPFTLKGDMATISLPQFVYADTQGIETTVSSQSIPSVVLTQDELKKIAAYKAVEFVESGMVLGLGTGSTAWFAIERIGELLRLGNLENIVGVPTSKKTEAQAISLGIPLSNLEAHPFLDLAIDGADEVDPYLNLVKGRGGSLLREKMIEGACRKFVVIVDESKLVKNLGGTGLAMPVEVVPFCWKFTAMKLEILFKDAECVAKLKTFGDDHKPFLTDNSNYIVEMFLKNDIGDLNAASDAILRLPGVVEHGMFIDMATTVIVAGELGITIKNK